MKVVKKIIVNILTVSFILAGVVFTTQINTHEASVNWYPVNTESNNMNTGKLAVDSNNTHYVINEPPKLKILAATPVSSIYTNAIQTYTVTYYILGVGGSAPVDNNAYQTGDSVTVQDIGNVTRIGYTFTGWSLNSSGTGTLYLAGSSLTVGTDNIYLYATWKINTYTVNFEDYDGTVLSTQTVDYLSSAITPLTPSRTGYLFTGWDKSYSYITSDLNVTATYTVRAYNVTFEDYDGTVLYREAVDYETSAIPPANPSRTGYTFTGWDTDFNTITGNTTVTATYSVSTYSVSFKDYDGTVLSTQTIVYGNAATAPANPSRTGYTFNGWDIGFNYITTNLTVNAQYTADTYTVTFKDYDGTVLNTQLVDYRTNAFAPVSPSRTGYTFTGWDTDFSTITGNTTVTATYSVSTYSVSFKDYDGTVLSTQTVVYGSTASAPANPTRIGYQFNNWDTDFSNVTSDLTVNATYTINTFTVTFKDYDGTVLNTQTVDYGTTAFAPPNPLRTGYQFNNWDTDFSNVTSDLTVNATYTINTFTVTFKDYDGTILNTQTVDYGTTAFAPANPLRTGYLFNNWDTDFSNVTSDLTVNATYTINTFTVTFKDYDGTVLNTQTVDYGTTAFAPANPTRTGYLFNDWDTDFSNVTSNLTVNATYTINTFTVTFKDYDGTVLNTQTVDYGSAASAPANPTRTGYTFIGWDTGFNAVTSDITINAAYTKNKATVTIIEACGIAVSVGFFIFFILRRENKK